MSLIEKRYAEAFVDVAEAEGMLNEFKNSLKNFADIFELQLDFKGFLLTPEISFDVKRETLLKILGDKGNQKFKNFILLLLEKGRIKHISDIYKEYCILADKRNNILNITIISAFELSIDQVEKLKDKYKKEYCSKDANVHLVIEPSLIGGLKIQIGDRVIDGSIKGRLDDLKNFIIE